MIEAWIKQFKAHDLWLEGEAIGPVGSLTADSREAKGTGKNIVFFARKGISGDGHDYLAELAGLKNISAFVVERKPEDFKTKTPLIVVRDSTEAMALAAKSFYKDPTADSLTVAVTGTNGKTTSTVLLQALLTEKGCRTARSGTIDTQFEGKSIPAKLTTPDFLVIQRLFSELKAKGANAFVFEASSHALEQRRISGIELNAALFTNLSPEHLDYHQNMDAYYLAKRKVFADYLQNSLKKEKIAVIGRDESYGTKLIEDLKPFKNFKIITWGYQPFSSENDSHLHIYEWKSDLNGIVFKVNGLGLKAQEFHSKLIGKYNIDNIAGMISLGLSMDIGSSKIQNALNRVESISGRLERVAPTTGNNIFVDYAHTPDALENVLNTLRPLTKGRLRVVFGCGGDRDRTKRPRMGEIAELYADELFVTSDNPRTEDPQSIIQEILKGLQRLKPVTIEADRKKAIGKSLEGLTNDDVVLVAGKGHENYQILGTKRIHFDDKEVVHEALGIPL